MKGLQSVSLFSIVIFVFFFANPLYSQSIYYVKATAPPGGDGQSWNTAFTDIQQALDDACNNSPSQIWIAAHKYYPTQSQDTTSTGPDDRSNTFTLCNDVELYGGFVGTEAQLDERNWVLNQTILTGDIDRDDTIALNA